MSDDNKSWSPEWAQTWFSAMPALLEKGRNMTPEQQAKLLDNLMPVLEDVVETEGGPAEFAELLAEKLPAVVAAFNSGQTQTEVDRVLSLTPAGRATLRWRTDHEAKFSGQRRQIPEGVRKLLELTHVGRATLRDADGR